MGAIDLYSHPHPNDKERQSGGSNIVDKKWIRHRSNPSCYRCPKKRATKQMERTIFPIEQQHNYFALLPLTPTHELWTAMSTPPVAQYSELPASAPPFVRRGHAASASLHTKLVPQLTFSFTELKIERNEYLICCYLATETLLVHSKLLELMERLRSFPRNL